MDRRIGELAAGQHGVVSRGQQLALGATHTMIRGRLGPEAVAHQLGAHLGEA